MTDDELIKEIQKMIHDIYMILYRKKLLEDTK